MTGHRGMSPPLGCPVSDVDLWSEAVLADPFPTYRALRDLGPVAWLSGPAMVAFPRFQQVRSVLSDWQRFSSAAGVAVGDGANRMMGESILTSDPPVHDRYRKPLMDQLSPNALAAMVPEVEATAVRFAAAAVEAGRFDAVAELARPYSLTVVADLIGLPAEGREHYPPLAERAFNVMGPANERAADGFGALAELRTRTNEACRAGQLTAGRRADQLCHMGRSDLVGAYTWPGIDTTVNALGAAVALFARHPDQWDRVRADRSLIPSAFNEVLRLHSPVHYFTRVATETVEVEGVTIAEGSRVLVMYGSANRDERRFPDPDRFDVTRNPTEQLAFGRGVHLCVGINLARIEAHSLLAALADRVARFETDPSDPSGPTWLVNNTLHGLEHLPVRVVAA